MAAINDNKNSDDNNNDDNDDDDDDNDDDKDKDDNDEPRHHHEQYNIQQNLRIYEIKHAQIWSNILPNFIQKSSKEKLNSKSSITCPKLPSVLVYKNKT